MIIKQNDAVLNRKEAGTTVKGKFTPGADVLTDIKVSIQPLGQRDQSIFANPDTINFSDMRKIYSNIPLILGDRITYGSDKYLVISVDDWTDTKIKHHKAYIEKIGSE